MRETTPLAPSTAEAAAATERLAAWVIGALTTIVIGGVALVIYGPRGGHAGGSSWLPAINASLNATATILLSTGYVLIRRRRVAAHRTCLIAAFAADPALAVEVNLDYIPEVLGEMERPTAILWARLALRINRPAPGDRVLVTANTVLGPSLDRLLPAHGTAARGDAVPILDYQTIMLE